ncbi:hypothetical protein [Mycolicibacterium mengxianglii]|nr:hypothetical protein [Mycolicibacterium mengxianglii]
MLRADRWVPEAFGHRRQIAFCAAFDQAVSVGMAKPQVVVEDAVVTNGVP